MADPATYRPEPGSIPTRPGVYRFRDKDGRVIYVGKAKSLRARLSSYFQDLADLHPRTADDGDHGGLRRVDRRRHRGRGAPAGVLLDQGVRPAVQREVPRRQVLPVARGHDGRGVPARHGRARRQEEGRQVLRALQPRLGHPRDRRHRCCASSRCAPAATASSSAPARSGGRACSATSTSARRRASGGSTPTSTARSPRTSPTSWAAAPTSSSSASSGRCTPRRTPRTTRRPRCCATTSGRCNKALEKQAVVFGDGTDADVIALAEDPLEVAVQVFHVRVGPHPRAARLGRRPGRGPRHRGAGRGVPAAALRRRGPRRDPARGPRAGDARGRRDASSSC